MKGGRRDFKDKETMTKYQSPKMLIKNYLMLGGKKKS